MTIMIRQNTKFPLLLDCPDRPDYQATHCPTANFGPLSSGSITNPILITVFDTYLTPVLSLHRFEQDPSDSECSALNSLACKSKRAL